MSPIPKTKGDCEFCTAKDEQLYQMSGGLMCRACMDAELAVDARRKEMKSIIEDSRAVDAAVVLKTDVFLARTVAAVELESAISQNPDIPDSEKQYALAKESMLRFQTFKKAVFSLREQLTEAENEMRMWQVNTTRVASSLHEKYRAEFAQVSINYKPTPITKKSKTTKPVKSTTTKSKGYDRAALTEACQKFNIPSAMVYNVRMMMVNRNGLSEESAAKEFAEKMGLL